MRRLTTVAARALALAVAVGAGFAAPSLADAAASPGPTFAGQCQFAGTSSFSSPVTTTPSPVRNRVTATGTCSGTITASDGRTTELNNAAAEYRATEFGAHESCLSDLDAVGRGALVLEQGTIRFSVVENRISGQAALSYTGVRGGSAVGVAYVNSSDPAGLLEQCATSGLTSSPVDIFFQTTPAISG